MLERAEWGNRGVGLEVLPSLDHRVMMAVPGSDTEALRAHRRTYYALPYLRQEGTSDISKPGS